MHLGIPHHDHAWYTQLRGCHSIRNGINNNHPLSNPFLCGFSRGRNNLVAVMSEVFDKGKVMASSALNLDAVREGYRWLALQNPQGHSIPRCGLLVKAQFLEKDQVTRVQSLSPTGC